MAGFRQHIFRIFPLAGAWTVLTGLAGYLFFSALFSAPVNDNAIAHLDKAWGTVTYRSPNSLLWQGAGKNQPFAAGDLVATNDRSGAMIKINSGHVIELESNTLIKLSADDGVTGSATDGGYNLQLLKGTLFAKQDTPAPESGTLPGTRPRRKPVNLKIETGDKVVALADTDDAELGIAKPVAAESKIVLSQGSNTLSDQAGRDAVVIAPVQTAVVRSRPPVQTAQPATPESVDTGADAAPSASTPEGPDAGNTADAPGAEATGKSGDATAPALILPAGLADGSDKGAGNQPAEALVSAPAPILIGPGLSEIMLKSDVPPPDVAGQIAKPVKPGSMTGQTTPEPGAQTASDAASPADGEKPNKPKIKAARLARRAKPEKISAPRIYPMPVLAMQKKIRVMTLEPLDANCGLSPVTIPVKLAVPEFTAPDWQPILVVQGRADHEYNETIPIPKIGGHHEIPIALDAVCSAPGKAAVLQASLSIRSGYRSGTGNEVFADEPPRKIEVFSIAGMRSPITMTLAAAAGSYQSQKWIRVGSAKGIPASERLTITISSASDLKRLSWLLPSERLARIKFKKRALPKAGAYFVRNGEIILGLSGRLPERNQLVKIADELGADHGFVGSYKQFVKLAGAPLNRLAKIESIVSSRGPVTVVSRQRIIEVDSTDFKEGPRGLLRLSGSIAGAYSSTPDDIFFPGFKAH